jgi:hypothetical protein
MQPTEADFVEGRKQARIHGVPDDGGQQFAAGWARAAQHFADEGARLRQGNATLQRDLDIALSGADHLKDERDRLQARHERLWAAVKAWRAGWTEPWLKALNPEGLRLNSEMLRLIESFDALKESTDD